MSAIRESSLRALTPVFACVFTLACATADVARDERMAEGLEAPSPSELARQVRRRADDLVERCFQDADAEIEGCRRCRSVLRAHIRSARSELDTCVDLYGPYRECIRPLENAAFLCSFEPPASLFSPPLDIGRDVESHLEEQTTCGISHFWSDEASTLVLRLRLLDLVTRDPTKEPPYELTLDVTDPAVALDLRQGTAIRTCSDAISPSPYADLVDRRWIATEGSVHVEVLARYDNGRSDLWGPHVAAQLWLRDVVLEPEHDGLPGRAVLLRTLTAETTLSRSWGG